MRTNLGEHTGADGMKAGFTCASGFNLVASATRDGHRLGDAKPKALPRDPNHS